jgi:hypothetical protein
MNTQLSEGLEVWKAGEFERHVQRYISANHDPSAKENGWPRAQFVEINAPLVHGPNTMSWRRFNKAMGVDPQFLHPTALISRVVRAPAA